MEDTGAPWFPSVSEAAPGAATTRPHSRPAAPGDLAAPAVPDQENPEGVVDQEVQAAQEPKGDSDLEDPKDPAQGNQEEAEVRAYCCLEEQGHFHPPPE